MDRGFENRKLEGLFSKMTHEGVRDDLGHWIGDGRLRVKEREKERGEPARIGARGGGGIVAGIA